MMDEKLHPQYVRGLIDAEGCFYVAKNPRATNLVGFRIYNKNAKILKMLQDFFGCGYIYENNHGTHGDVNEFILGSKNHLRILLRFFEEHGDPIVKQTNRPRNKNSATTFKEWKETATEFVNRPDSKYDASLKEKAKKLREHGYTYKEIADTIETSQSTAYLWITGKKYN